MNEVREAIERAAAAIGWTTGTVRVAAWYALGARAGKDPLALSIDERWRIEWIADRGHYLLWHSETVRCRAAIVNDARSESAEGIVRQLFRALVDDRLERAFAAAPKLALVTEEGGGD